MHYLALVLGLLIAGPALAAPRTAIVAGGCFWCVESDFESVPGVSEVIAGFTGGDLEDPTYKQVGGGGTGHYEAVEIHFDDAQISYAQLIQLFFRSIDPTDDGGQFCDRGASYRTAIFVQNDAQRKAAEKEKAEAEAALGQKIVTPILKAGTFWPAEGYHQDYYKGTSIILTRRGFKTQSDAYKFYRKACGRDARVKELWGDAAPFVH
ncbi:peptide-methionine (S)-S-oxide reductase MsrA [Albidovulum sediminis]|uniref:Peptide methionine sulfoxide reductase MsrA n=1 Tax=Albidovulum sediminis TaxID=3066345 RepID=A0ABT2NUY7_9RHOB|nr:peptide-methionine (S)-S-oxide reductase MsrA [Defluviimonas sediminis]MCT8331310.1 peptide-methionine (S)-S-oxide reductase MsrA [Defluviimonas sediminis]